ncbi:MAG: polymer-forming cytoskeletal protein [Patescibacteria group bacterium]
MQSDEIKPQSGRPEGASTPSHLPIFNANKNTPATIIAKGVKLEGEFKSQGDVLIEGEVVGNIQTDGLLTAGPESLIKAGISAADAVIAGKVEGNLQIKHRLEIRATARIKGDTVCQTIGVEAGAVLQGNVRCGEEVKVPAEVLTPKEQTIKEPLK